MIPSNYAPKKPSIIDCPSCTATTSSRSPLPLPSRMIFFKRYSSNQSSMSFSKENSAFVLIFLASNLELFSRWKTPWTNSINDRLLCTTTTSSLSPLPLPSRMIFFKRYSSGQSSVSFRKENSAFVLILIASNLELFSRWKMNQKDLKATKRNTLVHLPHQ